MKNIYLLFIISIILISQNVAFSQSKMIMGGGVISSIIKESSNSTWTDENDSRFKPFVGFSYEYSLNNNLFLLANMNYSRNKINSYFFNNTPADFAFPPKIRFVQISAGASINYKIFSSITQTKFLQGFNTGIGFNIDNFRDFDEESFGFTSIEPFQHENQYQLGLLCHLSWDYKKFRLSYNFSNGVKMFGNERNIITSADWQTFSASYIYTLSD